MVEKAKTNGEAKVAAPATTAPVAETPKAEAPATKESLMAELQAAMSKGDFKAVAAVSRKIDTLVKAEEKAAADAKLNALKAVEDKVKAAIDSVVKPLMESGTLDAADGVWYSYDFGDTAATLRLSKAAAKSSTHKASSGGTGKKFAVTTEEMLAKHAEEQYKETGMTFKAAYDSNTDKNYRYGIRQALLKLEGLV